MKQVEGHTLVSVPQSVDGYEEYLWKCQNCDQDLTEPRTTEFVINEFHAQQLFLEHVVQKLAQEIVVLRRRSKGARDWQDFVGGLGWYN